jgi:hypothetical protein
MNAQEKVLNDLKALKSPNDMGQNKIGGLDLHN